MTRRTVARQCVLVVLDGAADRLRVNDRSPLDAAWTPHLDMVAREGCNGLMTTLYDDLPRESLVAHLGLLGWDPHRYYPGGRASSELAVIPGADLGANDVVFRANLGSVEGGVLRSFNAGAIESAHAADLVQRVDRCLRPSYPEFKLYHVGDYRTLLVIEDARIDSSSVECAEPHSSEGLPLDLATLVHARSPASAPFAERVNAYLRDAAEVLMHDRANALLPWGLSTSLRLPAFATVSGITGRAAIVGAAAFLSGISATGGLDFVPAGNGRPDSDFRAKGRAVVDCLDDGYEFVCCHINGPDEASHLHDPALKIHVLERIDAEVIRPVFERLRNALDVDPTLVVLPDHYSNSSPSLGSGVRQEIHSLEPVPFTVWNGREHDDVDTFGEDAARFGRFGSPPLNHLQLCSLFGSTTLSSIAASSSSLSRAV